MSLARNVAGVGNGTLDWRAVRRKFEVR